MGRIQGMLVLKVGSPCNGRRAFKEFISMSVCLCVANPCRQQSGRHSKQTVQHREFSGVKCWRKAILLFPVERKRTC